MVRPCFLVVDHEYASSISTRKLVIETAKLNVITAYSSEEALETLRVFPNVTGMVIDAGVREMPCAELVRRVKEIRAGLPVVVVDRPGAAHCAEGDYYLEAFDPKSLLELLQSLNPEETERIRRRNEELAKQENS